MDTIYHFKVNAELKDIVGRDLINSDNIAVIELVKNAYDANSPSCMICFKNENCNDVLESSIEIQDFGHGMDFDDITGKWLNIAYSEKKVGKKNKNRHYAGNKGVGRFSCDRLGKKLYLCSRKADSDDYVVLSIDWGDFEGKGQNVEISDVPVDLIKIKADVFEATTGIPPFDQGTYIRIFPLRVQWTRESLLDLRRALERFINPHQAYDADSFKVSLNAASQLIEDQKTIISRRKVNGEIENVIFQELGFRTSYIESSIDSSGNSITTSLYHRGERLFQLIEKNRFSKLKSIKIAIYFLNQYNKAYFAKETGISAVDYGSIYLFLNGFRVPPFGERGDDWLGMDNRKTQGIRRYLGTRDVMGRIEIYDEDNVWRIVSNREGMVHTDALYELIEPYHPSTSYFYTVLKKLEKYIVDGLRWDSTVEKWHAINDKVLLNKNDSIDEKFAIVEKEKNINVVNALQDIIRQGTKIDDIISLDLDYSLIKLLSEHEVARTEEFLREFALFSDSFASENVNDSKVRLKSFLRHAESELAKLHNEREIAREEARRNKEKLDEEQAKAIENARRAAEELEKERQAKERARNENLFLKAEKNRDIEDVINLHHQVITWSQIISKNCDTILGKVNKKRNLSHSELLDSIGRVRLQAQKILKVAKLATNANFRVKTVAIEHNILNVMSGYIGELAKSKLFREISVGFTAPEGAQFVTRFTPIEVTILIDSLISNSKKANASKFVVSVETCTEDELLVLFDDNGAGLQPTQSAEEIFLRGVTTTDGAGIGLHHARNIVGGMGGTLSLATSKMGGFALMMRFSHEA